MSTIATKLYIKAYNAASGARSSVSRRRGAGFIEYAMLALVAVGVLWIVRTQFTSFINTMWARITNKAQ